MTRKTNEWKLRTTSDVGDRTLIMGVLNVTPDSFSDGGQVSGCPMPQLLALSRSRNKAQTSSTLAPNPHGPVPNGSMPARNSAAYSRAEELKGKLGIPVSVDTYKAEVAEKALEHGASASMTSRL